MTKNNRLRIDSYFAGMLYRIRDELDDHIDTNGLPLALVNQLVANRTDVIDSIATLLHTLAEAGEESPQALPSKKLPKLAIIIGHTARSKGAYSPTLVVSEYDYWREVATCLLVQTDLPFECTVITRDVGGISGAYRRADTWGADATIELHFNASASLNANGWEYLTYAKSKKGNELAKAAARWHESTYPDAKMRQGDGIKRLKKGDRGYHNLTAGKAPAILVEPFFGSSPSESRQWANKAATAKWLIELCRTIAGELSHAR